MAETMERSSSDRPALPLHRSRLSVALQMVSPLAAATAATCCTASRQCEMQRNETTRRPNNTRRKKGGGQHSERGGKQHTTQTQPEHAPILISSCCCVISQWSCDSPFLPSHTHTASPVVTCPPSPRWGVAPPVRALMRVECGKWTAWTRFSTATRFIISQIRPSRSQSTTQRCTNNTQHK